MTYDTPIRTVETNDDDDGVDRAVFADEVGSLQSPQIELADDDDDRDVAAVVEPRSKCTYRNLIVPAAVQISIYN